ncbi:hypothetical protein SAMN05421505_10910 [Sinosporangium album]|uniref:Uncharacterized protein n=1 Tax=Sinosporangium album TaxID=504805 RepID=A0A1G7XWM5_9ACTN|nr:hypothetical protein SAMN05421505_10910 [Sinosporangium album]
MAKPDFPAGASRLVGSVVLGECLLKLQCNPFTHNADSVNGVDRCFDVGIEHVSSNLFDHFSGLHFRLRKD